MQDKKLINNLKDLKFFYEKGIIQAKRDRKNKEVKIMKKKIKELEELIDKYI